MIIESINCEIIKVLFNVHEENLLLGDIVRAFDSNNGVVAQVFKLENSKESSSHNVASLKIISTLELNNTWTNWKGNIPSKNCRLNKASTEELLSRLNIPEQNQPISLGCLSAYKNVDIITDVLNLEKPTVIFSDFQSQRVDSTYFLSEKLANQNFKTLILDFRGEYIDFPVQKRLFAGKDIKLPLNFNGIENLYERTLSGASVESRAIIEDIFIQVQDYANSCESGFIPFADFKEVIDAEYLQSSMSEIILLKNQLNKLERFNIFANKENEIHSLEQNLSINSSIIIDFSEIPPSWHKPFVEFIIDQNITRNHQYFLLFETRENNIDSELINKLYIQGYKSGIRPVLSTEYGSNFCKSLTSIAKNLILFSPKNELGDFLKLGNFLNKLNSDETLIYGEFSKNIPLIINLGQESSEDIISEEDYYNIDLEEEIEISPATQVLAEEIDPVELDKTVNEIKPQTNEIKYNNTDDFYDYINSEQYYDNTEEVQQDESVQNNYEDFYEVVNEYKEEYSQDDINDFEEQDLIYEEEESSNLASDANIPIYKAPEQEENPDFNLKEGDKIKHEKYGIGLITKIISYGNKKLCSIQFDNIGKRLLDPSLAVLEKVN